MRKFKVKVNGKEYEVEIEEIKEELDRREDLPHACIISGPVGSGRHTLAKLLAAALGR